MTVESSRGHQPLASHPRAARIDDLAHVTVNADNGMTIATIDGEVDISNVDHIADKLTELSNPGRGLIVDLRTISFIDSAGIALLHDVALRLRQRLQQLIIVCAPGSQSRRVLELAGLATHAAVLDDIETALAALRSPDAARPDLW